MEGITSMARIIDMNAGGERVCAAAAKISSTPGSADEIFANTPEETEDDRSRNRKLIKKVLRSGHMSVIEHINFNIAFTNVSAVVEQFLIEFRLASFMVKSRRYVDFSDSGYHIPARLSGAMREKYVQHINSLYSDYNFLTGYGVPKEDARFVLPYCFHSNLYCTANARELIHILLEMTCGRGSYLDEIKSLGAQLLSQIEDVCPSVRAAYDQSLKKRGGEYEYQAKNIYKDIEHALTHDGSAHENGAESMYLCGGVEISPRVSVLRRPDDPTGLLREAYAAVYGYCEDSTDKLIERVFKGSRRRELEQLTYTVRFNGLSLSGVTHLVRHRMQSIIVPPLYTADIGSFISPESIMDIPICAKTYMGAFERNAKFFEDIKSECSPGDIAALAPYLCLSGNTLDILTTMNAREMYHFFKLRTCNRAQWEIRRFASELLETLREISPEIFGEMGPSCYCEGSCPEGKLSCGKAVSKMK